MSSSSRPKTMSLCGCGRMTTCSWPSRPTMPSSMEWHGYWRKPRFGIFGCHTAASSITWLVSRNMWWAVDRLQQRGLPHLAKCPLLWSRTLRQSNTCLLGTWCHMKFWHGPRGGGRDRNGCTQKMRTCWSGGRQGFSISVCSVVYGKLSYFPSGALGVTWRH
jgi:hypothetical protein